MLANCAKKKHNFFFLMFLKQLLIVFEDSPVLQLFKHREMQADFQDVQAWSHLGGCMCLLGVSRFITAGGYNI